MASRRWLRLFMAWEPPPRFPRLERAHTAMAHAFYRWLLPSVGYASADGLRVNVGCGDDVRPGFLNVDVRPVGDVVATVTSLPLRDGSVALLVAQDVLEHFPRDEVPAVLGEWRRALCEGGTLRLRVPNMARLGNLLRRQQGIEECVANVYGGHRFGDGGRFDTHHWGWTPFSLEDDLRRAGFVVVDNDLGRNMVVDAVRATGATDQPRGRR